MASDKWYPRWVKLLFQRRKCLVQVDCLAVA